VWVSPLFRQCPVEVYLLPVATNDSNPASGQTVDRRLEFETLIADTLAALLVAEHGQLEATVLDCLGRVREFFCVDRCALLTVSQDLTDVRALLASYSDGTVPVSSDLNLAEAFPWSRRTLLDRRAPVRVARRADLPPDADDEREAWAHLPIQAALTLPIETRGVIRHLIVLNTLEEAREWPDAFVTRLQVLGGLLVEALERGKTEEALRRSYAEIERLRDRLQAEADYLKAEMQVTQLRGELTGRSAAIQQLLRQVTQVAPTDSTVLVRGETGTGKELVAQMIHRLSPRQGHVLVVVNCAALPSGLIESELFGRERGAYTGALTRQAGRFEVADGSTIFLDEVGELSLEVQAKLLRVLESGTFERLGSPHTFTVNVRLIAATNRDLADEIRKGRFREDLYYRLNVFPIAVPPLRERREDIPQLVWTFLEEFSSRMGKRITQVPRKSMEDLQRRAWPGNVRELRNVIEHAAILTSGPTLRVPAPTDRPVGPDLQTLEEVERAHILRVLGEAGGQVKGTKGAAAILGLHPSTLYSRMAKLGIKREGR
jgi:transcriptional regulator with GAF, ATPase, and Fis domain